LSEDPPSCATRATRVTQGPAEQVTVLVKRHGGGGMAEHLLNHFWRIRWAMSGFGAMSAWHAQRRYR